MEPVAAPVGVFWYMNVLVLVTVPSLSTNWSPSAMVDMFVGMVTVPVAFTGVPAPTVTRMAPVLEL
jgi:hypothetical protein